MLYEITKENDFSLDSSARHDALELFISLYEESGESGEMRLDSLEIRSRGSPQTRGNARGLVARLPRKRDNGRNTPLHGHFFSVVAA